MEKKKIVLYSLHGVWDTAYTDGTSVLGISENIEDLHKKLEEIEVTKAKEYLENPYGDIEEESGMRYYEIRDAAGGYAKFYITEHYVEISDELIEALHTAMQNDKQEIKDLRVQIDELNKVVGTPLVDEYKKRIKLPQGWHLDFGLSSNKYCVVDRMGARVL